MVGAQYLFFPFRWILHFWIEGTIGTTVVAAKLLLPFLGSSILDNSQTATASTFVGTLSLIMPFILLASVTI